MQSTIKGTTLPVLEIGLAPGDKLIAESGQLSWMSGTIQLHTTMATGGASGFFGAITRAVGGGGLFMTEFTAPAGPGLVAFAAKIPGRILEVDVTPGQNYMIHRHGFLCATQGVELGLGFQRSLGAGIFGGDGFKLQKLGGQCKAWVELGGEVITYELAPGETIQVHPGHVGMFTESIGFDVTLLPGIKNMFFGGDGIFVARLTGPGKVWLQSLTLPNFAHALAPYLGGSSEPQQNIQTGIAGGIAGSVLRGIFDK
jgi:uncharacterized protein (TIGR00266 family)